MSISERRCQWTVRTNHERGTHRCYHAGTIVVEGHAYCREHAKTIVRRFNEALALKPRQPRGVLTLTETRVFGLLQANAPEPVQSADIVRAVWGEGRYWGFARTPHPRSSKARIARWPSECIPTPAETRSKWPSSTRLTRRCDDEPNQDPVDRLHREPDSLQERRRLGRLGLLEGEPGL